VAVQRLSQDSVAAKQGDKRASRESFAQVLARFAVGDTGADLQSSTQDYAIDPALNAL